MKEIFGRFNNPVFVATLIEDGDVLQLALEAGYPQVFGTTTSVQDTAYCRTRFQNDSRVHILDGEESVLNEVLKDINIEITFCLDSRAEPPPAIIQELSVIKHHRIKSHTILVRNVSLFGTEHSGWITKPQVIAGIRSVNEMYTIRDVPEMDMLAATIP